MVPDWSLRPAGVEDRAMLFRLREETMGKLVTELFGPWDDTVQWEYFDRWFRPESTRIVQVGGQDVGVIGLDDRGDETYVTRVEIHPEWQNRGIGTAVIERVMAEAAATGTAVSLNVFSANPAWRLYERLGFSTVEDRDGRLTMRATPRRRPSTRRRETVTNRRVRRLASMTDRELIQAAYEDLSLLADAADAVHSTIAALDAGEVRVAERRDGEWVVNVWVKEAILLYFRITEVRTMGAGPFEYHDKIPTKTDLAAAGIRVVPPGTVRYGAFCEPGVVVMPGYVNIGAHVGSGTMVDTWATVGSCAQVGRDVHISGGVGIGGVLEPPNARPVIIEDGAFIGSRSIVVEGVVVESGAVLGANTTLSASIPIIDVTGDAPVEIRGRVPANAIVVPGARARDFPAGTYHLQSPLLIGYRTESTDTKTTLNEALRTFEVEV